MRVLVGTMQFPALVLSNPRLSTLGSLDEKFSRRPLAAEPGVLNPALHPTSASLCSSVTSAETEDLKLWGLSLGMTLDLLSYMSASPGVPLTPWDSDELMGVEGVLEEDWDERSKHNRVKGRINAPPSLTSVFPRFSYPDVNFWIWYVYRHSDTIIFFNCTLTIVLAHVGYSGNVTVKSSVVGKRLSELVVQMILG